MSTLTKPRRTRLRPEERRAQLLKCALSVFAEQGIARATHSHVAELAGVSVPAVYSYFRTREDLVGATLHEVENYLDGIRDTLDRPVSAHDALADLGQTFVHEAQSDPDMIRVWLDWSTGVGLDVWPQYLEVLDRMHKAVENVLARGKQAGEVPGDVDIQAAARIYIGGGHTVALMKFAGVSQSEIDQSIEQLIGGILGVRAG